MDTKATGRIGAVIPAAGSGSRMGGTRPKQFLKLGTEPILLRTVRVFLKIKTIDIVVTAVPAAHYAETRLMLKERLDRDLFSRMRVVTGGSSRQESVRLGIAALPNSITVVLVHDAARPLVSREIIERCTQAALRDGAAIAAIPVNDTIKQKEGAQIIRTLDRTRLVQAQTPQAARLDLLMQAFAVAEEKGFIGTDEASVLEYANIPVSIVEGGEHNFKITRQEDLLLAEALIAQEQSMKIGHGFDAHRLVKGRELILGGVAVSHERGLAGHSDADVLCHALMDALLGALGRGDIGSHFPDTDESYKGISSLLLLEQVMNLVREQGLELGNADMTLICQQPKLAPYIPVMRSKIAALTGCEAINIKATTTEKMGYAGRGEGISAHAVVLLK